MNSHRAAVVANAELMPSVMLPLLKERGYIKNEDVRKQLNVTRAQAHRFLRYWVGHGWLKVEGERRGTRYVLDTQ